MLPPDPPLSTLFILLLAATISFLTSLANRLLTNPEETKAWRKEVSEWNSELRKAQKDGDKKRVEKLMKQQQQILRLQSKMMMQSFKVMLLFFVPLILIWQVLGNFYYNRPETEITPIALLPGFSDALGRITIPVIGIVFPSLYWWYLMCSFFFGTLFSRMFGLTSME